MTLCMDILIILTLDYLLFDNVKTTSENVSAAESDWEAPR